MKYTSKACSLAAALITYVSLAGGANAALVINIAGVSGAGVTTWTFSGSSLINLGGSIRNMTGGAGYSGADTTEFLPPTFNGGNLVGNATLYNQVYIPTSGSVTLTIGAVNTFLAGIAITNNDEIGIRVPTSFSSSTGQLISWSGSYNFSIDINSFNLGSYDTVGTGGNAFVL